MSRRSSNKRSAPVQSRAYQLKLSPAKDAFATTRSTTPAAIVTTSKQTSPIGIASAAATSTSASSTSAAAASSSIPAPPSTSVQASKRQRIDDNSNGSIALRLSFATQPTIRQQPRYAPSASSGASAAHHHIAAVSTVAIAAVSSAYTANSTPVATGASSTSTPIVSTTPRTIQRFLVDDDPDLLPDNELPEEVEEPRPAIHARMKYRPQHTRMQLQLTTMNNSLNSSNNNMITSTPQQPPITSQQTPKLIDTPTAPPSYIPPSYAAMDINEGERKESDRDLVGHDVQPMDMTNEAASSSTPPHDHSASSSIAPQASSTPPLIESRSSSPPSPVRSTSASPSSTSPSPPSFIAANTTALLHPQPHSPHQPTSAKKFQRVPFPLSAVTEGTEDESPSQQQQQQQQHLNDDEEKKFEIIFEEATAAAPETNSRDPDPVESSEPVNVPENIIVPSSQHPSQLSQAIPSSQQLPSSQHPPSSQNSFFNSLLDQGPDEFPDLSWLHQDYPDSAESMEGGENDEEAFLARNATAIEEEEERRRRQTTQESANSASEMEGSQGVIGTQILGTQVLVSTPVVTQTQPITLATTEQQPPPSSLVSCSSQAQTQIV